MQAELFILRLSRNSGVLGLAGMAFTSQLFSSSAQLYDEGSKNEGILLVRPLLHFYKEDMYKVSYIKTWNCIFTVLTNNKNIIIFLSSYSGMSSGWPGLGGRSYKSKPIICSQ